MDGTKKGCVPQPELKAAAPADRQSRFRGTCLNYVDAYADALMALELVKALTQKTIASDPFKLAPAPV